MNAENWKRPSAEEIAELVASSGLTQAQIASRSGVNISRLKRLLGKMPASSTGRGAPLRFGEWLALRAACTPTS